MASYKVICLFADMTDNDHIYNPGDDYPRYGYTASKDRIAELSTNDNSHGMPLIAAVEKEDDTDDDSRTTARNPKRFNNRIKR